MNLEKLEKLSCLQINEEDKHFFEESLSEVFDMMDNIANVPTGNQNDNIIHNTDINYNSSLNSNEKFSNDNTTLNRDKEYEGIQLTDGLFLAPKVISK